VFGAQRLWGTREGGFYNPEIASFGSFRFTTGKAGIDVPVAALQGAQVLKFDLFTYAGETERRWVKIHLAEKIAWEGTVPGGIATVRVPMPSDVSGETVRLTLLSETISLAKSGVLDRRDPLGVGLIGVRALRGDDRTAPGSGIQGFRSRIRLLGGQPLPLQIARDGEQSIILELLNAGTHAWPVVREIGGPQGAVQIAVRWRRRGEAQFVGDNRVPMSVALHPGDQMRLRAPLKPVGLDGKRLPPGEYDVHLGMVRETVALFADNGDAMLTVPVVVHD
jgi:hypothetical protein